MTEELIKVTVTMESHLRAEKVIYRVPLATSVEVETQFAEPGFDDLLTTEPVPPELERLSFHLTPREVEDGLYYSVERRED